MSASPTSEAPARDAHLLGEWARLALATLREAGVRDLWVSPGSRSTPFTWAAHHTAGLNVRSVVDERSAGFMALGHARITGQPCALLCTSGSAAANYFPAVVEAAAAHVPLVVLTADRPHDVQHAAAAQTIDQIKLYGAHARAFFDFAPPEATATALQGLRRAVAQAVATSLGPLPGPVHLNLRARKPLEPAPAESAAEHALTARVSELLRRPLIRYAPEQRLSEAAAVAAAQALAEAASVVIAVGPLRASAPSLASLVAQLSERLSAPIFAEAGSQVRFMLGERATSFPLFDWLLSTPDIAGKVRPELLLCLGHTPTSSAFERWAATVPRRIVLAEHGFPDPIGGAELVASGELASGLSTICSRLPAAPPGAQSAELVAELTAAHERCAELVRTALRGQAPSLTEAQAVKTVVETMPDGSVLMLGNSLPLRDVDAYVTSAAELRVLTQRGANGIDGLVAGAIGAAVAARVPTLLLLGDVSLAHDLGSLTELSHSAAPLVIAVIDNAGGRIFDQLPVKQLYRDDETAARLWRTPLTRELAHAAALFGMSYRAPTTTGDIREALSEALQQPIATLLHLKVEPTSAERLRRELLAALAAPNVRG